MINIYEYFFENMAGSSARSYLRGLSVIFLLLGVILILLYTMGIFLALLGIALIFIGVELLLTSGRIRTY